MDRHGAVLSIWPEIHSLDIFWYKNEFHEIFDGEWYAYDMQSGSQGSQVVHFLSKINSGKIMIQF